MIEQGLCDFELSPKCVQLAILGKDSLLLLRRKKIYRQPERMWIWSFVMGNFRRNLITLLLTSVSQCTFLGLLTPVSVSTWEIDDKSEDIRLLHVHLKPHFRFCFVYSHRPCIGILFLQLSREVWNISCCQHHIPSIIMVRLPLIPDSVAFQISTPNLELLLSLSWLHF